MFVKHALAIIADTMGEMGAVVSHRIGWTLLARNMTRVIELVAVGDCLND